MSSGELRKEALRNVEDMISKWGFPDKHRLNLREQELKNRLVKTHMQLLQVQKEAAAAALRAEQRYALLENKLERWKEFFESAMARNRENAELKREIERLKAAAEE